MDTKHGTIINSSMMFPQPCDPLSVAENCPGPRRYSSSPGRRQNGREGRSRTSEGPKQRPVRRIRSYGPGDPSDGASVVERHRIQEARMVTCEGVRQGVVRSMTTSRRVEGENMMVRELEELRARTAQMEKTLRFLFISL